MKKLVLIAFLFWILTLPVPAFSRPVINSVSFSPSQEIWVGETLQISVNCTDCYPNATMVGRTGYTIYVDFVSENGLYTARVGSTYWRGRADSFNVTVYCSDGNETVQSTAKVNVSEFIVDISKIYPDTIYFGDIVEVNVLVKKNTQPISSPDVKFNITLDGLPQKPEIRPPHDPYGGWIIFLNSSKIQNPIGTHELQIFVSYDRVNSTKTTSFTINEPIQFSIISIDKSWVKPNDTITLKIQALERGRIIPLNTENLAVKVGATQARIIAISPSGNLFSVTILAPSLSSGRYSLTALLSHKNYTYTSGKTIDYIVPISGKFVDENERGISVRLSFFSDTTEKLRLYTDSAGTYSGNLPPGTYDVEITFPQSKLRLYDAEIKSFEDPIKYYYFGSADLDGIDVVGLFVYEVAIPYYKASIEMKYDERNVVNENLIKVYKCENWNSGKKECYGKWSEVPASIDSIRNVVHVNTTSLSAYAIGTLKKLSIDFTLNKEIFYLKDLVRLKGMVVDGNKNPVSNASVGVKIKDTAISAKTFSDKNGLFTIEFLTPEKEGNYSLIISAEKHPYLSFNSTLELKVVKSKDVYIVFPDTVRISQGDNFTQEFSVVNIGQSELYNLSVALTGISSEYYSLIPEIEKLEVGEERKLSIVFTIPQNASVGTSSAMIKVFNEELTEEKIFGFTVLEKNQKLVVKPTTVGFFGKISLPQIFPDSIYILIFALIVFSSAFLLKRRKIENQDKRKINDSLFELKEYLKNKHNKISILRQETTQKIEDEIEEEKGIG